MTENKQPMDSVSFIMEYEGGDMAPDDIVARFQDMIDSGLVWQLQGHYGRTANNLIRNGYCVDTHNKLGLKGNDDAS